MEITSILTKETFKITRLYQFDLWRQERAHINVSAKDSERFLNYIRKASEPSERVFEVRTNKRNYFMLVKGLKFKEETPYKKAHTKLRCLELNNLQVLQVMNGLDIDMGGMHGDKTYAKGLNK